MDELAAQFARIPWASMGRASPAFLMGRSLVPLGLFDRPLSSGSGFVALGDDAYERHLMEIVGTGIQVGRGKFLTCWHVCRDLPVTEGRAYIQTTCSRDDAWFKTYRAIETQFSFVDPRTRAGNPEIDVGMVICPAIDTPDSPFDDCPATWGDSTLLGVGDRVLIGGYPLGRELFLATSTNRGVVQPTFYDGVISAIIPATKPSETRLLQVSSVAMGGISGGAVCDADSGRLLGMVTSGLERNGVPMPITYAIPSEVLQPWAAAVNFRASDGTIWR
jgi:hypothetical protein